MNFTLEDFAEDVVNKAMTGHGITRETLANKAKLAEEEIDALLKGNGSDSALEKVATVLNLNPSALVELSHKAWVPEAQSLPGLKAFTTDWKGIMEVNAYLAWDLDTRQGVVFDSGADATPILQFLEEKQIQLTLLLLTHSHPDHIADLDRLITATGVERVFTPAEESVSQARTFDHGKTFDVARLKIQSFLTRGHSPGGATYLINGLPRPVAIVGDALFSGSMGGPKVSYADALETNRKHIFSLPDGTILCPGHGPMTTVAEEKIHNPFFPEFSRS